MKSFNLIKKHALNVRGKSMPGRYLVFESDDWGSIRVPDKQISSHLIAKGLLDRDDPFSKYDSLENESDLSRLFDLLFSFKDQEGNNPVFTANMVVCNPDFNRIKRSDFSTYYHERFTETFNRFSVHGKAFDVMKRGAAEKVFFPQFHAREHVNAFLWMSLLQQGNAAFREAFELNCFAINHRNRRRNLMATYDYYGEKNFDFVANSIREGLEVFEDIFQYRSLSTIAPCYVWDDRVEGSFFDSGVQAFQGSKFQNIPSGKSFRRRFHYNGETNSNNQLYFIRNCLFEPSLNADIDWVDKCLESIDIAFKWRKPAIVGTHRLNYVSGIESSNASNGLQLLRELLTSVLRNWPDTRFVTTADLLEKYATTTTDLGH